MKYILLHGFGQTSYKALEKYCEKFKEPLCLCGLSLGGILAMEYTMPKNLLKLQNILVHVIPNSIFSQMGFQKAYFINLCKSMFELNFFTRFEKYSLSGISYMGRKR